MDSSSVLYADYHAISRFFTKGHSYEIYFIGQNDEKGNFDLFSSPILDIRGQYFKSKYFVDVIENRFFFDFQITTCF